MYSESDLDHAVAIGALTADAAAALRAATADARGAPAVDEESFRLVTGFNDIFVTIAAALLLSAFAWIGSQIAGSLTMYDESLQLHFDQRWLGGGLALAAGSWGLAEYFTRIRRMALPSIVLLLAVSFGAWLIGAGMAASFFGPEFRDLNSQTIVFAGSASAAGLVYLHWLRFHVPITVAALTVAVFVALWSLLLMLAPVARDAIAATWMLAGLAIFAYAMWWDMSDRQRTTRRSDVAFWLHLAAAPMIAHPLFALLGLLDGEVGVAQALLVLALYVAFGFVALAVDRRALLVSALFYVLYALAALFREFGAVSLSVALTALVIGSALLTLSAFWHPIRRRVLALLPDGWRDRLPPPDRPAAPHRPA